jgi:hypothetical protein
VPERCEQREPVHSAVAEHPYFTLTTDGGSSVTPTGAYWTAPFFENQ